MLRVSSVSRSFGERRVLDQVTFEVAPGRLTGFVGANGAGKTTTMRIILGVIAPHSGTVTWRRAPVTQEVRQRFGYMPAERGPYPELTVADPVTCRGRLHGLDRAAAQQRTADLLERLQLEQRAGDPVERHSMGNQQRVQVAAALVHDPELLILDEPFSGLDPIAVEVVLGVLSEYADRGVPVLFSSHQLDVVERLCDQLVIIAGGRIRATGTPEQLRERHGVRRHQLSTAGDACWVRQVPGAQVLELDGGTAVFEGDDQVAQQVLSQAVATDTVLAFGPLRPSLSEIFKDVVTDEQEEAA